MNLICKFAFVVVSTPGLLVQSAYASNSTSADDACYHNVIRDALNTGKTLNNLWDVLTQRSHNFATETRPNPPLPSVSNDFGLKNSAKTWARNCEWRHSNTANVGENIYWITEKLGTTASQWAESRNGTVQRAVNTWAYEAAFYSLANNSCQSDEQCGHYTQIVWNSSVANSATKDVGCVAQFCPDGIENTSSYLSREATYVVCQYKPAGNYIGVKPYIGQSTSSGSSAAPISGCGDGPGGSGVSGFNIAPIMLLLND
jgi:hypothetical protein